MYISIDIKQYRISISISQYNDIILHWQDIIKKVKN